MSADGQRPRLCQECKQPIPDQPVMLREQPTSPEREHGENDTDEVEPGLLAPDSTSASVQGRVGGSSKKKRNIVNRLEENQGWEKELPEHIQSALQEVRDGVDKWDKAELVSALEVLSKANQPVTWIEFAYNIGQDERTESFSHRIRDTDTYTPPYVENETEIPWQAILSRILTRLKHMRDNEIADPLEKAYLEYALASVLPTYRPMSEFQRESNKEAIRLNLAARDITYWLTLGRKYRLWANEFGLGIVAVLAFEVMEQVTAQSSSRIHARLTPKLFRNARVITHTATLVMIHFLQRERVRTAVETYECALRERSFLFYEQAQRLYKQRYLFNRELCKQD